MAITNTPRLGLPQWGTGGDTPPTRDGLNAAFLSLETKAAKVHDARTGLPTPTSAMTGDLAWDGITLWWCDWSNVDGDPVSSSPEPIWRSISSDWYVNVMDYGVRQIPMMDRLPVPPAPEPPNYDPMAYARQYDCGPAVNAALEAARAPAASVGFPLKHRRRRPIFFPPGQYVAATEISASAGAATPSFPSDVTILGSWPHTVINVIGNVTGTDGAGAPVIIQGIGTTQPAAVGPLPPSNFGTRVFDVVGEFDRVVIDGFVFRGIGPVGHVSTEVYQVIGINADAEIEISNIKVELSLGPNGGAIGIRGTRPGQLPKLDNINLIGPVIPRASRTGVGGGMHGVGIFSAMAGGAALSNITITGYKYQMQFDSNSSGAALVTVDGVTLLGSALADFHVLDGVRLSATKIKSIGGARALVSISNATGRNAVSLSGSFDATQLGWPSDANADDFIRLHDSDLTLSNFHMTEVTDSRFRPIGVTGCSHSDTVKLDDVTLAVNPDDLFRVISDAQPAAIFSSYSVMNPTTGVVFTTTSGNGPSNWISLVAFGDLPAGVVSHATMQPPTVRKDSYTVECRGVLTASSGLAAAARLFSMPDVWGRPTRDQVFVVPTYRGGVWTPGIVTVFASSAQVYTNFALAAGESVSLEGIYYETDYL